MARTYPKLGRAIALREALQEVLADGDLPSIRWWLGWADRSRLEPFRKLSRTLKHHFHGTLAYLETRLTNAAIEAVNGLLQWLSALPAASVTSITSALPPISKLAV